MKRLWTATGILMLLSACVSSRPDHFYILSELPQATSAAKPAPTLQASLKVTLPALVDRPEMLLNTSADGVIVLEHERWAAPLDDLVTQTLARDLEQRRPDMLVAARDLDRSRGTAIKITVDIVQMTVRKGGQAAIAAQWRILDPRAGTEIVGADKFSAALGQDGYAAVAKSLSECLALLADRLTGLLR